MPEYQEIRKAFTDAFILPYFEFVESHKAWISSLRIDFDKEYYDKMFMWDRIVKNAQEINFSDALTFLSGKSEEVFFLTESPKCVANEFCRLNNQTEFVAASSAQELAECIAYEWFTEYELAERNCYLADPILPSDLYVFDKSISWCLIFTHETDESEAADSRFCLCVN